MSIKIGEVEALFRYPVKSMRGEALEEAELGWQGFAGDRRLALRRLEDRGGFPWLTAGKLPELILFSPVRRDVGAAELPTHVCTPEGEELPIFGPELAAEVGRRHGSPVEMMHFKHGIFDEGSVSVIASATVAEVGGLVGLAPDVRRFRPNVLISSLRGVPFEEDAWVGGVLSFGKGEAAAVSVTLRDERCSMVNFDPDTGEATAELLRSIVRTRDNKAGVYGAVTRCGRLAVGQPVFFEPARELRADGGAPLPS